MLRTRTQIPWLIVCWSISLSAIAGEVASVRDDGVHAVGKQIFKSQCAQCHGDQGQGNTEAYDDPLAGDLSISELAEIVSATMPEDDPESCVGQQAHAVASYMHHAFYSPSAQIKISPPKIKLARLTAEQLRQSVADLYGHFGDDPGGSMPSGSGQRGISGTYFTGVGAGADRIRIDRIDDQIDFDFGRFGPGEEIDPQEYFIRWKGSLLVPRSGRYQIVVRGSCSFKMQFGRLGPLFINNHVQSAGKEEFRRTIQLTGGRAYPIRIDMQQRKRKTRQPPVRFSLSWVPPGGTEEIIPVRHLLPRVFPASYALQSKLPPDDRSYGYERGITVDRAWDQSTTDAAVEFAETVIDDLFPRYLRQRGGENRREKLREFLAEVLSVAFRAPISAETHLQYIDRALSHSDEDDADAIRLVVIKCFKSPRFLYPALDSDRSNSRRVASRLALVLFDSLPADQWLLETAAAHRLNDRDQIFDVAGRMVDDYRAQAKIRRLLYHWFDIEDLGELVKDNELYPEFDDQLVGDLKHSFDAFLDEVVNSEASDFRQLLQADWAFTTERIADFYGDAWRPTQPSATLARSVADPEVHVGALTHPLLMARFAHHNVTSPIHRGVFLSRYILGRVIRPPQQAFNPLDEDLHPGLTTRQRIELQTSTKNCQACHQKINPLGFALENFDAVGQFRGSEKGKPIDSSGGYQPRLGDRVKFVGARQLGDYLAGSEDCHRAFIEAAFEHLAKQPIAAYGPETTESLLKIFRQSGYHIRQLIVEIATIVANEAVSQPGA